jgi:hypothetical protein
MTNEDLAKMRLLISTEVARAVKQVTQDLRTDIDALRAVDTRHDEAVRRHSGAHKDLAESVRQSSQEIRVTVGEQILAAQSITNDRLEAFDKRIDALEKGAMARAATAGAATSALVVGQTAVSNDVTNVKKLTKLSLVLSFIVAVLNILAQAYTASHQQQPYQPTHIQQ